MILFFTGMVAGVGLSVWAFSSGAMWRSAFYAGRYSGIRQSAGALSIMRAELIAIQDRLGYKCGAVKGEG